MAICKNCGKSLIISGGKCLYCGAEVNAPVKTRWYADFVFCIDCSPSMASVIDSIKDNVYSFIKGIEDEEGRIDWRAKFVGFHDTIIFDNPIVFDSDFISSLDELRLQLDCINAEGPMRRQGCDTENEPRSVLGAIWRVARTTEWRRTGKCLKHVMVLTDAPPKPICDDDLKKFAQVIGSQHITLEIWGKKDPFWEKMLWIPKSEIEQFYDSDEFYYHKTICDFGKALNRHISYLLDSEFDEDDIL